jgi:GGDEF domain-containing protein
MNLNSSPSTVRSYPRLLAPTAFNFVLNRELRRAMRSSTRLSLVVIETTRSLDGVTVTADERTIREVAQLINDEMRDHDLFGFADEGTLSLVLRGTDYSRSVRIVDRLLSRLETHQFATPIQIALGAACYPMHAMGAESLKRWAQAHPIACCRGRIDPPDINAINARN